MAKLLRGASERGHLVIGLGDFNMTPGSLSHRLLSAHAPVRDVWRVVHPDSSLGPADNAAEKARGRPVPTAEHNVRENGATSDSAYNTWRWSAALQKQLGPGKKPTAVPPDSIDPRGKRLDYIFAGSGDGRSLDGGGWVVKRVAVGMRDPHPVLGCSLSDHFSVEATLAPRAVAQPRSSRLAASKENPSSAGKDNLQPPGDRGGDDDYDEALQNGAYLQSPGPSEGRGSNEFDDQPVGPAAGDDRALPLEAYDEILAMIHKYVARERRQRRWRAAHFFAWVTVAVGCLVAVWFTGPRAWVAFVLMLASSLGLAAGTVDGLISLLFIGTELRALREFEWEVMNAKAAARAEPTVVEDPPEEQSEGW